MAAYGADQSCEQLQVPRLDDVVGPPISAHTDDTSAYSLDCLRFLGRLRFRQRRKCSE